MKKILYLLSILFVAATISAIPIDTGFITWEQPDGSTFTARMWGDEFIWRMEDSGGYRMIQGSNGWFYYAQLDGNGEYTPTAIAVDESITPPAVSYQLERSQARMDEIQAEIDAFAAEQAAKLNALQNGTPMFPTTGTQSLAVVLVDFAHNLNNDYAKEKFDSLFFSTGYWIDDNPGLPDIHPDGHLLFGSFRDYWLDQSNNQLDMVGKEGNRSIINPEDQNNPGKALWVQMPEERSYYTADSNGYTKSSIKDTFKVYAENQLGVDLDSYSSICFIYAGKRSFSGEILFPSSGGNMFVVSERTETYATQNKDTYLHIGASAHEFGHVLGASDEYDGHFSPAHWSLMANGGSNGLDKESCPAPLSPGYKISFGWAEPIELEIPTEDLVIPFDATGIFYKVLPFTDYTEAPFEYFIIERRLKEGFDKYTPTFETDLNAPLGILIWRFSKEPSMHNVDFEKLLDADVSSYAEEDFRFPSNGKEQIINDRTDPSLNLIYGNHSYIEIVVEWSGAFSSDAYATINVNTIATEITSETIWRNNKILGGPLVVKSDAALILENGADITFNTGDEFSSPYISLEEGARFIINGSQRDQSTITATPEWLGIKVHGALFSADNLVITNSDKPIYCSANSTIEINNSTIKKAKGISTLKGKINITNSVFYSSNLEIINSDLGSSIQNTVFYQDNFVYDQNPAIKILYPEQTLIYIDNCTFNMIYQGVHFSSGVEDPDKLKYPIFTKIRNNIFTNCHEAIYTPPDSYPPAEISYNNFFQNTINNHLGNNFIKVDPRYIDAGKGDFNLNWGSGCIDSGDPIISNDPDGTRADIGSLYYDQTPVAPSSLDINSVNHHPHLTWPAEVPHHAGYNIYATYELYEGGVRNEVYHTANTSYTDESVDIVNPLIANQTVTYEVTSLNSIAAESDPSPSVSREVDGGVWKQANEEEDIPLVYKLKQNYPNPFNPSTTIKYELPDEGHVVIKLYDVLGREIQTLVNESKSPGRYEIKFDGSKLSSGVYIYRIEAGQFTSIKKLMLMK